MPTSYFQTTLENSISCAGIGTHSGLPCSLLIKPAPENTGFVFIRSDLPHQPSIKSIYHNVTSTHNSTTISAAKGTSVSTIEHLIAALSGMGVDNAFIDISAEEVPILDGSSAPFCALIAQAKLKILKAPRRFLQILKVIDLQEGDRFVRLSPSHSFSIEVEVSFRKQSNLPSQKLIYKHSPSTFRKDIAPARTYGFFEDLESLHQNGLALGSSLENALVYKQGKVMNKEGVRFKDECVRHKILDVIGDLSLIGHPILGHFEGNSPGHSLNYMLVQKLMQDKDAWRIVPSPQEVQPSLKIFPTPRPSSLSQFFPANPSVI